MPRDVAGWLQGSNVDPCLLSYPVVVSRLPVLAAACTHVRTHTHAHTCRSVAQSLLDGAAVLTDGRCRRIGNSPRESPTHGCVAESSRVTWVLS